MVLVLKCSYIIAVFIILCTTASITTKPIQENLLPRCGRPPNKDIEETNIKPKWSKTALTYKFANILEPFNRSQINDIFQKIAKLWTKGVNLTISESKLGEADIYVHFENMDGKMEILGYAFFPEDGDIFIDQQESWSLDNTFDYEKLDINWVMAHELGHSLGLNHSMNTKSIMNAYYQLDFNLKTSIEHERNELIDLYGELKTSDRIVDNSNLCEGVNGSSRIDAMMHLSKSNQDIIIKGSNFWTFTDSGLQAGPFALTSIYQSIPDDIDAAFVWNKHLYVFKRDLFYKFTENKSNHKMSTIQAGFPGIPDNLDGVYFNYSEKKIYFFKESKYYVLDITIKDTKRRLVVNGSEINKDWKGLSNNIDAVTLYGSKIIFVKGPHYYLFDAHTKKLLDETPLELGKFLRCQQLNK